MQARHRKMHALFLLGYLLLASAFEGTRACRPASAVAMQGSYTSIVLSSSQKWRWNVSGANRNALTPILMWWDNVPWEHEQFFILNQGRMAEMGENDYFHIYTVMATIWSWTDIFTFTFYHNAVRVNGNGDLDLIDNTYGTTFEIVCDACSGFQAGHYAQGCLIQSGGQCVRFSDYWGQLKLGDCNDDAKWDFWA